MDGISLAKFLFSFLVVLGLIGLFALALKKFGGKLSFMGIAPENGKRAARLTVLEYRALSPRHRLVLVKRDTVEHLLLLGPEGSLVVERGIGKTGESV